MKKASSRSAGARKKKGPEPRRGAHALRPEYDFAGGERGKYSDRFAAGRPVHVVVLAPDVAEAFGSARAVNAALRRVLKERQRAGGSGRHAGRSA